MPMRGRMNMNELRTKETDRPGSCASCISSAFFGRVSTLFVLVIMMITLCGVWSKGRAAPQKQKQSSQDPADGSRQVTLESFIRARPRTPPTRNRKPSTAALKVPRYQRKTPPLVTGAKSGTPELVELGLTLWRLRPFHTSDRGARLLVMDGGQTSQWTPERIEVDQPLSLGDRVRMSIESPKAGYLYVIDREQYTDGTRGSPYLIFPTSRTRGGDHHVEPGTLIDIPGQDDLPPYFTLNSMNPKYAGELLTIMVLSEPLPSLTIGRQPLVLTSKQVARWEKDFGFAAERFEMDGGSGMAWTAAERVAAQASGGRSLTQGEPAPQTIYRVVSKKKTQGILIQVPIRYQR
jgi:hypothetical protein